MLLWIILAAMTGLAALLLLWPLARGAAAAGAPDDAAFYRAALADIDRDASRGLIGAEEAKAAKTEAARRLLRSDEASAAPAKASAKRHRAASMLALVATPALALFVYLAIGSPHLPGQPLAARKAADPASINLAEAIARIEAHLAKNPNDGGGYEVLAPVYARLGRLDDAARAFGAALRLNGETPDRLANFGEALVAQAGGVVTASARDHFERAAAGGPHAKARYYLALSKEQDGDRAGAIAAFEQLIASAASDAPWLLTVRGRLDALKATPAGGEAIAALPAEQQAQAIRGMVEGLSERLASQGGGAEEWARLVRSRMALGEREKAAKALSDARAALGADAAALLDALGREFGL